MSASLRSLRLRAGLSQPSGQDRRAVSGRRRHRRADPVRRRGLEQRLGQPFIVENRGGAGTTLGATAVARSEPDGYTIMVGTASTFAVAPGLYKRLAYDPAKDFSPIMLFATVPFVLMVNPSLGVNTVQGAGRARQEQARRA